MVSQETLGASRNLIAGVVPVDDTDSELVLESSDFVLESEVDDEDEPPDELSSDRVVLLSSLEFELVSAEVVPGADKSADEVDGEDVVDGTTIAVPEVALQLASSANVPASADSLILLFMIPPRSIHDSPKMKAVHDSPVMKDNSLSDIVVRATSAGLVRLLEIAPAGGSAEAPGPAATLLTPEERRGNCRNLGRLPVSRRSL